MITQPFVFKEWLPDQPELGNHGLIEATNTLPVVSGYKPMPSIAYTAGAATVPGGTAYLAYIANGATKGSSYFHLVSNGVYRDANGTQTAGTFSFSPSSIDFSQYENVVLFASGGNALAYRTLGAVTSGGSNTFNSITGGPLAGCVGVVGQFVVAGDISSTDGAIKSNYVQWSAIDNPVSFPEPGSATAIAAQAGEQGLYEYYGPVRKVHGGDQFGVVLQAKAVTRMTYIGGSAVFQFDLIDSVHGCVDRHASINVGGVIYYVSPTGFCRTNGSGVELIGEGKVDDEWAAATQTSQSISCAWDPVNELVCFGKGSRIFFYNPTNGNWSSSNQTHQFLITPAINPTQPRPLQLYDASGVMGALSGTPGTAVFTTGEVEMKPGGYSHLSGFKPLVSGATAVSMTVAVGTRNGQDTAPSFTSETSVNSRTGFADFRSEARYHRTRVTITGDFEKAIGGEFKAAPSGEV